MRITTKGRYAVRAMANLAISGQSTPKSIRVISAEEGISPEFLEQIFYKLKKVGVINSTRGPSGGFVLAKSPDQITIKDIFLAVEEGLDLTPCTACDGDNEEEICSKADTCQVYEVWRETSEHITSYFAGYTLQRIIDNNKTKTGTKTI